MIRIIGATGKIQDLEQFLKQVQKISKDYSVTIQTLDAEGVYGKQHLLSAAEHAIRAVRQKTNTTRSLAMEVLLYASGERQITLSLEKLGVQRETKTFAFVIIDSVDDISETSGNLTEEEIDQFLKTAGLKQNDSVLEGSKDTLIKFGIAKKELNTITKAKYGDLILEKVAMVDIIK